MMRSFRQIAVLCLALAGAAAWGGAACGKPYHIVREVRDPKPQTFKAYYIFYFCGSGIPRLFERSWEAERPGDYPFHLALPDGLITPEYSTFGNNGNTYVLTAYRYKIVTKHTFTGRITTRRSPRIDLIAWRVLAPWSHYVERRRADGSTTWVRKVERRSISRRFKGSDHRPEKFKPWEYSRSCDQPPTPRKDEARLKSTIPPPKAPEWAPQGEVA